MIDTRRKGIFIVLGVVAVAAVVFGAYLIFGPKDPYAGLTLWRETEIDETTRVTLEQRIATTKASIALAQQEGREVDPALFLSLGSDAYILGDLVTAREAVEASLNDNSLNPAVWNTYGNLLSRMGDLDRAEDAYLKAIEAGLTVEEYYADLYAFLHQHHPEQRERMRMILELALDNVGRTASLMSTLGDWYYEEGDCARAIDHYEVAEDLSPSNEGIANKLKAYREACQE